MTTLTDDQFSLSIPNSRDEFEVPVDPLLGRIFEITDLAVEEIGRHAVADPVETGGELSVTPRVNTEPTSGLDVDEALRNAYKAQDDQFTVAA